MPMAKIMALLGGAAFLGLAGVAAARSRRSTLAMPTALLCVDMFAYSTLEALGKLTRVEYWEWLESAAAALAAPLLFHLVLAFLGERKRLRVALLGVYLYFGAIALSCGVPFLDPARSHYPGQELWALLMLVGILPTFVGVAVLLVRHYRRSGSPDERARTQLFIATVVIGVGGPAADLASIAQTDSSFSIAAPALLISAGLLTALAVRIRLLRGALSLLVVNAILIGLIGVGAQLVLFWWVGTRTALFAIGTLTVTLVVLGAARTTWTQLAEARERTAHLTTLGRLSAQMAHDIRNPLAAIHGAAQYLEEERRRGGSLEDAEEFLTLILEQTQRLEEVVRSYRRLGRAQPVPEAIDVGALIESVAKGAGLAHDMELDVSVDVDHAAHLDPELIQTALENVVRNAFEAMDGRGTVHLRAWEEDRRGRHFLWFEVTDEGPGMDARTRESAEEAFFTTKAQGSGLGLAFCRRVAEAHGGHLEVDSALGHGTTVRLAIPLDVRASLPAPEPAHSRV